MDKIEFDEKASMKKFEEEISAPARGGQARRMRLWRKKIQSSDQDNVWRQIYQGPEGQEH